MNRFSKIADIQSEIKDGSLSVGEVVRSYLQSIEERNGRLNAFLSVYGDECLQQAEVIDRKFQQGNQGKLAGLVVGIKDIFAYKDHRLQCSSKILDGFQSLYSATCVQRLVDEDAIIIGHQNCDEFGMGSSNEHSAFGAVSNPINSECVAGGSSGGSAAAVAAGLCMASIGSDTGGSVRQPASFCGTIGFKPTYGRISRYGLGAYASSFDTVGILAQSIEDVALLLDVISGDDGLDSTAITQKESFDHYTSSKKYKIVYFKEAIEHPGLSDEVKEAMLRAISMLQKDGHEVVEQPFPLLDYMLPTYYVLTAAEASSNLSRYDGVRYGARDSEASLHDMYVQTRSMLFGEEVKRRIMTGTFVTSSDYYDAYYMKAQKVRSRIIAASEKLFQSHDFVLSPTAPTTAFKIGELKDDPLTMYLEDLYTIHANVIGAPAVSLPVFKGNNAMPIGVQFMAKPSNERELLDISSQMISLND